MKKIGLFLVPLFMLVNTAIAMCAINPSDVHIDKPLRNQTGEVIGVNVHVSVFEREYNLHPERVISEAREIAKQAVNERFVRNYNAWSPSFQGPPVKMMVRSVYFLEEHWPTQNPGLDPFRDSRRTHETTDLKFWVPLTKP